MENNNSFPGTKIDSMENELPKHLISKYGEFLSLSVWQPKRAQSFVQGNGWRFPANVRFDVSPDGVAWASFSATTLPPPQAIGCFINRPLVPVSIKGSLTSGGSIEASQCLADVVGIKGVSGTGTFGPAGMLVHATEPPIFSVTLRITSPVIVDHQPLKENQKYDVVYFLTNAIFDGLEFSPYTNKDGKAGQRRDRFAFASSQRQWTLQWLPSYGEETKKHLQHGILQAAPTATLIANDIPTSELDALDDEVEAVCWLLTAVTGCFVCSPIRQISMKGELLHERVLPYFPHSGAMANTSFDLIPNGHGELKVFLESTIELFKKQKEDLKLCNFIGWLDLARSQTVNEMQLLAIIASIELITYCCCLSYGRSPDQIEKMNMESKLNLMRKKGMRFIEKKYTSSDLRKGIRNPLIHSGLIPRLDERESLEWFQSLYDLAFRILLYILQYAGKYQDLTNNYVFVDAPASVANAHQSAVGDSQ